MDKRTIELALDWYKEAGIDAHAEGLKLYVNTMGYSIEVSKDEILWRAECQIHLVD